MQKDPYLYDDVPVLKNKLGTKNKELLEKFENDITFINLISVDECMDGSKMDFDYIKKIHKHIFGDVYEWAGEIRTIPIAKAELILGGDTIRYSHPNEIEKNAKLIIDNMNKVNWKNLNTNEQAQKYTKLIAALWKVHPFREGNTRTIMTFACHYAEQNGFYLERQLFLNNIGYTRNALVKASDGMYAEYHYLEKIMRDSIQRGEKNQVIKEIKKAGYEPKENLIKGMININNRLHKSHSVKDILNLYRNPQTLSKEDATAIKNLGKEFIKEERALKDKEFDLEL